MESQCRRCGRALKDAKSRERGIGPVCEAKEAVELKLSKAKAGHKHADIPINATIPDGYAGSMLPDGQCRVVAIRNDVRTNLRHVVRHSETGFSWGYLGSGPADLALSILTDAVGQIIAETMGMYQDFKFQFVASWPQEGSWQISKQTVTDWVNQRMRKSS